MHATSSPSHWFAKGVVFAALALNLPISAQDTNATCTVASLQWSFNSQKESPCVIASTLLGVCNGGDYNVGSLPSADSVYLGPTIDAANACQCNTVVYSLMSACSLCQNGTLIQWNQWVTNCATIYTSYPEPIPGNLHVPAYAYLDVESQGTFNADAAKQDANATESTAAPSSSATTQSKSATSMSQTSSPSTAASSTATVSDSVKSASDPSSNAIGGGVVGGVLGVGGVIILAGLFITYRRRRQRSHPQVRSDEEALESPTTPDTPVSPISHATPANMSEAHPGALQNIQNNASPSFPSFTNSSAPQSVPSINISSSSDLGNTH